MSTITTLQIYKHFFTYTTTKQLTQYRTKNNICIQTTEQSVYKLRHSYKLKQTTQEDSKTPTGKLNLHK